MTACKDSQATSGKKAVSATLAGVLAVGLVPAVALADEAVEVTEEDGITERFVGQPAAFAAGSATAVNVSQGGGNFAPGDIGTGTNANRVTSAITATGEAILVVPTQITPTGGAEPVTVATAAITGSTYTMEKGYSLSYYAVSADGKKTSGALSQVVDPGDYCVEVTAAAPSPYAGATSQPLYFTVAPKVFGKLSYYEVNPSKPTSYTDTTLTYTGSQLKIGILNGGTNLREGIDYDISFTTKGGDKVANNAVIDAGDYVGIVTGKGIYAGQGTNEVPFTVAAFDLSNATIEDITTTSSTAPAHPASVVIPGTTTNAPTILDPSLVNLVFKTGPTGNDTTYGNNGAYTYTAQAANLPGTTTPNPSIINDKVVNINKVSSFATYTYNGSSLNTSGYSIDLSSQAAFDTSKIGVWRGSTQFASGDYKVTVIDNATGTAATLTTPNIIDKAGSYTVKVAVTPSATSFAVGGTVSFPVTVIDGTINADADATIVYDENGDSVKEVVTAVTVPYSTTGINQSDFGVTVKKPDGTDADVDVDYTVEFTNANGTAAPAIMKDAGTYYLTVKGKAYNITGTSRLTITIQPLNLTKVEEGLTSAGLDADGQVATPLAAKNGGHEYIDTTRAVDLSTYSAYYNTGKKNDEGNDVFANLAATANVTVTWEKQNSKGEWESYNATTSIPAGTLGNFRAIIAPAVETEAGNYVFSDDGRTVLTYSAAPKAMFMFDDVAPSAWYFKPVYEAAQPKAKDPGTTPATSPYMNGYAGANLFGPNDAITRGQVACVLYNMAGGDALGFIPSYTENYGVDTGFSDVDGEMYYAKAIAWAKSTGVINGFAGTDQFGPDQNITREQFAAMLANYAQKRGATLPADVDGILAGISDGPSTSDWAKASVAWAVENEVMGRGGFVNPFGTASRAEVAAMAVNYQPRA